MFMHDHVQVGTELEIAHPVNLFNLDKLGRKHVLFAGGIGITPFMSMMEDLHGGEAPYELHYSVRSPEHAAFVDRLVERHGSRIHVYHDSEDQRIDFKGLLTSQPLGTHIYVCGPAGMIEGVINGAREAGWSNSHVHWEQFSAPPVGAPFEVTLAKSGKTVAVDPDQSLLEAIEAAGVDAPYLCRGGVCGECKTGVTACEGEILHHDDYLSAEEKASGKFIMPCVSRAIGKSLVLDL
jgi:ferredoxin-NADP reductase